MNKHTSKAFDKEIEKLNRQIILMGSLCEMQLRKAGDAFRRSDHDLAGKVIESDHEVNRFKGKIETDILSVMVRRQPVASDLRLLISLVKIVSELERIGDYASNISKRVITLNAIHHQQTDDLIMEMIDACLSMLNSVIGAVVGMDIDEAVDIWHRDHDVDKKFAKVMVAFMQGVKDELFSIESYSDMIFIARSCERIGDHITNISEDIYYACEGKTFLSERE